MPGLAIVTRDPASAEPYARALAARGYVVVAMPVTRTVPPLDPTALARALARPHDAILVASARGAAALVEAAAGRPLAATVWAVGPATARALAAGGITARVSSIATGVGLAAELLAATPTATVLVPRAEDGREEGVALLRAGGAMVDEVVAYRTVAVDADDPTIADGRARLRAGEVALCVVFSPSQVAALAALGTLGGATRFAAIGATTAAALIAAGIAAPVVAHAPTPEGLVAAL